MNYKGKPPSDSDKNTPDIIEAPEIVPTLHFTISPDSYDSFGKAITTKLANHAANHALEPLLTSAYPDWPGFHYNIKAKSTD
jgi:hypothetical protein